MIYAAITAIAPLLWGTTYFVTTEYLSGVPAVTVAMFRALPVGVLFLLVGRTLPQGVWWFRAGLLGALNIGIFFLCLFYAAYRLPGGVVATVGAIQPLLVILLSWLLLGKKPAFEMILFSLLGVIGVGALVFDAGARFDTWGIAAAVIAAISMATGIVLTKRWGLPVPLSVFTGWQLTAGGLILLPGALLAGTGGFEGAAAPLAGLMWIALVNTGMGYGIWFYGINRLDAWQVSILSLLSPVVAGLVGWLVLAQHFSGLQWAATGIVFASIIGATVRSRRMVVKPA